MQVPAEEEALHREPDDGSDVVQVVRKQSWSANMIFRLHIKKFKKANAFSFQILYKKVEIL